MDHMFLRDGAMTAAILGFFASVWFGWAQERPPAAWKAALITGSVLSVITAISGGILAWQNWHSGSVLANDGAIRAYLIILGIEFGVAALGAVLLVIRRKPEYLAPWICLVVGIHFYPMASVLQYASLYVLATVLTVGALLAVPLARRWNLTISAVTGVGAGSSLLLFAVWSMITLAF
ncbi:hypothetical protein [Kutzneria albida]|uniref:Uncharacterized protein n=1 Tax=Kutzneria albida DSM 43870 TaxID=1449976 RepID=W5WAS6_9PSEU|nr:hypothetical protein [Kutzneria albida]AHH98037.1 hypothetical protein KALB_4675 [Kutzneria albida DSM 43870]